MFDHAKYILMKEVNVHELKKMIDAKDDFQLIDVRELREHNHGYIPGAVNIPRGTLEFNIAKEEFWENAGFYYPENLKIL